MRFFLRGLVAACLCAAAPRSLVAQVGASTEIITGRVIGPDSQPLAGARLEVTAVATSARRQTTTRTDGRYTLLFRDGGSQFRITVTAIGMRPATFTLARRGDEDRLVADVRLSSNATTLAQVQIRARNARPGAAPSSTAGASEAVVPQAFLTRFPLTPGDLTAAATLVPGVTAVPAGDSTGAGISIGGQPANQNNVTLDGSSFLFGSVPQNSIRAVRVITNAYDPARGQFTGGQVATTTVAGTARTQGNVSLNGAPRPLQFPTVPSRTFDQRSGQGTAGFGLGGPLVKDRAFYFVSLDLDRRSEALASLLDVTPAIAANLGLSPDSLARFLAFAQRLGLTSRAGVPTQRVTDAVSSLARLDWDITPTSALMVRGDYRTSDLNATRFSPLALPGLGGRVRSSGGGVMASLTSSLGAFINEFRAYASGDRQELSTTRALPLGSVNVTSQLDSGRTGQAQLQFGANPSLPRTTTSQLIEASNEISWLTGRGHRLRLGVLLNAQRTAITGIGNQAGTFLYNSLADLEAGRPALYARTLGTSGQRAGTTTGGLYVADAWRVSPSLQVVYGTRVESSWLAGAPVANPGVQKAFGVRTEVWPRDVRVTPRLGFTYLLGNVAGIPAGTIKGGVGLFRGVIPGGLVSAVAGGNGFGDAQAQVICTGTLIPVPDWSAYATGAEAPTRCLESGEFTTLSAPRPTVLLFDSNLGAPEVWRASLGYSRQFRLRYAVDASVVHSLGQRSPLAVDRNLGTPFLELAGEGNRPVFALASDIVPGTGAVTGNRSRLVPGYGPALLIGSTARSRATQASITVAGPGLRGGGGTTVSYTYNRARDKANGFGLGAALPVTGGNPNAAEWGTSDLERRHQLVAQEFATFPRGFELAVIGRLISGTPYTPIVNGDVNADGQRNDRAFVPSPIAKDPTAVAMQQLLSTTDARAAECLRAQFGQVAARNSCRTGWTPQLDVQVNWKPRTRRLDDRVTISLIATNTLAGLDRLLHGSALRGWGQPLLPDRTLLTVTGFDAARREFIYSVNQRFGTPTGTRNPFGVPFQVTLRGQIALGTDASRANLRALSGNGGTDSISVVRARVMKQVPYPLDSLLRVADSLSLDLTPIQRDTITAAAARYRVVAGARVDEIVALLTSNNGRPDMGAIAPKLQAANLALVKAIQESIAVVERALTPAQWARVPDKIRFPFGQQQPGNQ